MEVEHLFKKRAEELQHHFPQVLDKVQGLLEQKVADPLVSHFLQHNPFSFQIESPLSVNAVIQSKEDLQRNATNTQEDITAFCTEPWVSVGKYNMKPLQDAIVQYMRAIHSLSNERFIVHGRSVKPYYEIERRTDLVATVLSKTECVSMDQEDHFGSIWRLIENYATRGAFLQLLPSKRFNEIEVEVDSSTTPLVGKVFYKRDGEVIKEKDVNGLDRYNPDYMTKTRLYQKLLQPALERFNTQKKAFFEELTPVAAAYMLAKGIQDFRWERFELEKKAEMLGNTVALYER